MVKAKRSLLNGYKGIIAILSFIIVLVGASTGATLWSTSEHASIRSEVSNRTAQKLDKQEAKEQYVQQKQYAGDMAELKQNQKFHQEQIKEIKTLMKKAYDLLIQQKNHKNN